MLQHESALRAAGLDQSLEMMRDKLSEIREQIKLLLNQMKEQEKRGTNIIKGSPSLGRHGQSRSTGSWGGSG